MLTGDYDLHGGYYGERIQLATTADFTGLVKNALNKIINNPVGSGSGAAPAMSWVEGHRACRALFQPE